MVIDPTQARIFLDSYQPFLTEVFRLSGLPAESNVFQMMGQARAAMVQSPALQTEAVAALEKAGTPLDAKVLAAVHSLQIGRWFYLRDTTRYSIFMTAEGDAAYAVKGLTQPISSIFGGSGLMVTAGIAEYAGGFVCDGIFTGQLAWIGRTMLSGLSDDFALLKKKKAFFTKRV